MRGRAVIKAWFDAAEKQLSRLGPWGSDLALTALAVTGAEAVHFLVRAFESEPVRLISVFNITIEMTLVALPIIVYSRRVIAELKRSKAELAEMSRRLEIAAEEAHSANRAKSQFLANMSHELRTPLNAIMGFSEIMKDQHLGPVNNPRYLAYTRDIHSSGRYLLGIINDILDLSKIEAGKMSLDSAEEFVLKPTVEASVAMIGSLADKFDVAVSADLPPIEVRMVAVERMVRQILINLVGNAIKFTPAGGRVHIEGRTLGDGGYELTVHDTGVGMKADDIAHALKPFGQIANMMSAKHTGTGLGLPLAKAMMELHGGSLTIASTPQKGTCVVLVFPATRMVTAAGRAAA